MIRTTRFVIRLWTMLAAAVATMNVSEPVRAEYELTSYEEGEISQPYYDNELPVVKIQWGSYTANKAQFTATCTADAYTHVKPGSVYGNAWGWGQVR